jgi:hypothetical protein
MWSNNCAWQLQQRALFVTCCMQQTPPTYTYVLSQYAHPYPYRTRAAAFLFWYPIARDRWMDRSISLSKKTIQLDYINCEEGTRHGDGKERRAAAAVDIYTFPNGPPGTALARARPGTARCGTAARPCRACSAGVPMSRPRHGPMAG